MSSPVSPSSRCASVVIGALAACLAITGCSRGAGEIPELSKRSIYAGIFTQIDRAEAIENPLARCLAYPDPPHLAWPRPLVEALCGDVHTPSMPIDDLRRMIDRRDWSGLHERYAGYLQRHRSGADPEKVLYRAFPVLSWKNGAEADRYTRRWVAARPDDAFANAARGIHLVDAAWDVRGGGGINQVPMAAQRRMYALAAEATGHLRKAIETEPALMPAYQALIDAYALGGKHEWIPVALEAAIRQSPDTYYVRRRAANFTQIKWGGSKQAMNALIDGAERRVGRNPRLAMVRIDRDRERADAALDLGHHASALAQYRHALAFGPDTQTLENASAAAPRLGYHVERLVYLTQAYRFQKQPLDLLLARGLMWESDGNYTRAKRDYRAAKALYPTDASVDKRLEEARKREAIARRTLKERPSAG